MGNKKSRITASFLPLFLNLWIFFVFLWGSLQPPWSGGNGAVNAAPLGNKKGPGEKKKKKGAKGVKVVTIMETGSMQLCPISPFVSVINDPNFKIILWKSFL